MDVFFYEAFEEEAESLKSFLPDSCRAGFTWKTIQEYGAEEPPAPIISVRTQSAIPAAWAPDLDAILSRSTGYDHLRAYREKTTNKVAFGYLPLYCHRTVAEQGMLMWMALARKLNAQQAHFHKFHRDNLTGHEIKGKTLLVVGVGNIGYELVQIGKGLGMRVLCVDLAENHPEETYVSIETGLGEADIVACSMDLTDSNRGYFHYDLLKKGKKGQLFVNVSRGELSPSVDLLRLLEEGQLGGVGLDAYNEEKALAHSLREGVPSDNPEVQATIALSQHPQGICTPHNAFNTEESVKRKSEQSIQQVVHFLENGTFIWHAP